MDNSKLFERVDESTYEKAEKMLDFMRRMHPSYRDDQLLMRLLCAELAGEGQPER